MMRPRRALLIVLLAPLTPAATTCTGVIVVLAVVLFGGCAGQVGVLLASGGGKTTQEMQAWCRARGYSPLCYRQLPWTRKDVRPAIEAARQHLRAQGFSDIEDLPDPERCPVTTFFRPRSERECEREFEKQFQFHTIRMMYGGELRFLRLSYIWLADHNPEAVRRWLDDHDVGRSLSETERIEASILDQGMIRWR